MASNDTNENVLGQTEGADRIRFYSGQHVSFWYTNHAGRRELRNIVVTHIYYGSNKYHKGRQWFLAAHDIDRNAPRSFAIKDIEMDRLLTTDTAGLK